jgi:excisionase family DNA binding protein
MNKEWLNLSGAAEMLGVHPSTIRKWSDEGKLPVHLTQGGHRRYRLDEVEAWKVSRNSGDAIDIDQLLDRVLHAVRVHIQNQSMESEIWYTQLDEENREHYRASGRSLAHAILFYLASNDEDGELKAQSVGFEYASRSRKHNLSVTGATRAYLFFRKLVLEAILASYQSMHGTSPSAWANMLRRFNQFTDQILLSIIANFESYNALKT